MTSDKYSGESQTDTKPALVLIATPIGNLEDISLRALKELRNVDLLCCEDKRRTGKLLELLEIQPRPQLFLINEFTERAKSQEIIDKVRDGMRVALVSDAGLPGVSDPGEFIVKEAVNQGVIVEVVPGPSAGITALVASGLSTSRYVFQGFIPRKGKNRKERLEEIRSETKTTIIYESGKRLRSTIEELEEICGQERQVCIARELTKIHEEYIRGSLTEVKARLAAITSKGECVVIIDGYRQDKAVDEDDLVNALAELRNQGKSNRDAVSEVSKQYQVSKRRVYELSIDKF
tara:strand:+ start:334 stop:1206 length:873 start_codon:yes stop_codon:yes gene_type:complete